MVGVGSALYAVDPASGALEALFVGPDPGLIGGIAVGSGGEVFFGLATLEALGVWRLDPDGSLAPLAPLAAPVLTLDAAGGLLTSTLTVLEGDGFTLLIPEIVRIDTETGTTSWIGGPRSNSRRVSPLTRTAASSSPTRSGACTASTWALESGSRSPS